MELHRPSGRRGLGLAYASTTMLLWGVLPLALREALRSLDPATLTAFRFAVSAGVLGAALAARGALPRRAGRGFRFTARLRPGLGCRRTGSDAV